jgi:hypothetical protein
MSTLRRNNEASYKYYFYFSHTSLFSSASAAAALRYWLSIVYCLLLLSWLYSCVLAYK